MSPRGSVIPMRGHAPPELAPPGERSRSIFPSVSLPICSRRDRLVAVSLFRSIGASLFLRRDSFRHRRSPAPWSLLKRTTCRALQVALFSTSRQCTPRVARESGIFSLGLTGLRFYPATVRIRAFCDLKGHPLHVAFRPF